MSTTAEHKRKVKMARRLRKPEERYLPLFQSAGWLKRKWAIMQRVQRQQIRQRYHKEVKQGVR